MTRIPPLSRFCLSLAFLATASTVHADFQELDETAEDPNQPYRNLPFFRVSGDYGLALHIGATDTSATPEGEDFLASTHWGWNVFLEAQIYPWSRGGLGGFYSWYSSEDKANGIRLFTDDITPGNYADKTTFRFYGGLFSSRLRLGPLVLLGGVGGGPLQWRTHRIIRGAVYDMSANTYGILGQFGLDLPVVRAIALGINARLILATARKYQVNGQTVSLTDDLENNITYYKSLNRLEASVGLRFGL